MYRKRIDQEELTIVIFCNPEELEEKISDWLYEIKCEGKDLISYGINQSIVDSRVLCTIIYTVQKIEIS